MNFTVSRINGETKRVQETHRSREKSICNIRINVLESHYFEGPLTLPIMRSFNGVRLFTRLRPKVLKPTNGPKSVE